MSEQAFTSIEQAVASLGEWFIYHDDLRIIVKLDDARPIEPTYQPALDYLDQTHGIICVDAME